ncbi:hypothetical protein [Streptomyces canus]|uniref:hypothetical protein n=1 Tax=Streptomyces canus TaxID=58343 RepID=UPI00277EC278|nr:hypothetical protein [Streptomyces canus]MDQ1070585.1 hypothetical protein [Streptomyces canus]
MGAGAGQLVGPAAEHDAGAHVEVPVTVDAGQLDVGPEAVAPLGGAATPGLSWLTNCAATPSGAPEAPGIQVIRPPLAR